MPNRLLARYFHECGLFEDLDIAARGETRTDELFAAWMALPDEVRNPIDAEQQHLFAMSCESGFTGIRDEATWHMQDDPGSFKTFLKALADLPNHYHRAMTTFLDHRECWRGATRFYHADNLPYWRKRKNMGHQTATVDGESIKALADGIRTYFHRTEGRGNNCVVEPFRRGELDYFFAYPEDYSQQSIEWVEGRFRERPHNPAFEVVYVYSQNDGTLDLNFRGGAKAFEPLQGIFSTTILKLDELPPDPTDTRVYDLSPLVRRGFRFVYEAGSGIEYVAIRNLRLSSRVRRGDRITVEADPLGNPDAIYGLLEQIGKSTPLHLYDVTQVEIIASVVVERSRRPKRIPIRLTHPNSCSLKYDDIGILLRVMLAASGIEPKDMVDSEPTEEPTGA
jgi:hypothetical protein